MPWKVPVYLSKEICIYKKPRNLRGFLRHLEPVTAILTICAGWSIFA